ncbi:MAG: GNAT family N-acetyltransferase [Ignavibacteria bacterium]|jgi:RimJ/RimL family protein N-acetyltransferase|nr:GNAT family N-acetyltransferase [Ignavibacteria bacterium]MCU7504864.1 GNAT family N-acetyltransferase [Ignavibacteria bacterium]MCU7518324.1 GNAT family N-acetyltransferase [Ignavibacteria bacterium]
MIELRKFTRGDFSGLIGWIRSPALLYQWAGTIFTFPLTVFQLENYLHEAEVTEASRLIFTVEDSLSKKRIGHIELNSIDRKNRSACICRVLVGPETLRGKGIGQEMIRKILDIGFKELDLHRIELNVFDFNTSAIACYEKAGFIREGLHRDVRKIGNEYWSLYRMSMLQDEWEKSKLSDGK